MTVEIYGHGQSRAHWDARELEPQPLFSSRLPRVNRDGSYIVSTYQYSIASEIVLSKRSEMSNLNEREKEKNPPFNTPANHHEKENLEPVQE